MNLKKSNKSNSWLYLNIISLLLYLAITYGVVSNTATLIFIDYKVKDFIDSIQLPWLTILMLILSVITNPYIFLLLALIISYKKKGINSTWLIITIIIGLILEFAIKLLIAKPRPNALVCISGYSYSFPSGHALISVIFFLILYYSFKSITKGFVSSLFLKWGSLLAVIVILFNRIYLNAHWLSDVIGGSLLAILIVSSVYLSFKHWNFTHI